MSQLGSQGNVAAAIATVPQVAARPARDPADIFGELGGNFQIDERVIKHMVTVEGMTSLDDFATFFTAQDEVGPKLID